MKDQNPKDPLAALGLGAQAGDAERFVQIPIGSSLANAERELIMATLEECRGNKTRAAVMLGISLKTLYNRLNAYQAEAGRRRG